MTSILDEPIIAAPVVIRVSGRTFRPPISTTIAHDAYMMKRMRAFGLTQAVQTLDSGTAAATSAGEGLIFAAFESGLMYEILAGALVEDGVAWTRRVADANTTFFAELSDPLDKAVIWENIAAILADFLLGAGEWSRVSLTSSRPGADLASPDERTPSAVTTSTTTENGTTSSENLHAMT